MAPSWFRQLNAALGRFLWAGKSVRVALRTCFISTFCGGLATSDVLSYYMASHLLVLNEWWYEGRQDPAYALERERMCPHPVHEILYSASLRRGLPAATQIVFLLWKQALKKIRWWGRLTRETPLWSNGQLPQLQTLSGFRGWDVIGVSSLGDVMHRTTLKSFQQLQADFAMPRSQFYKYLLFRHALMPYIRDLDTLPAFSPLEAKLFMGDLQDRKISKIYQTLVTNSPNSLDRLRRTWELDLGDLENEDWTEALLSPRMAAVAMRLRMIQFNYLHRVYFTRERLWRAGLIASPECLRCGVQRGDWFHSVWQCTVVARFWRRVLACLADVLGWEIPCDPKLALLHVMEGIGGNIYKRHFLLLGLTLAKRDIARHWKAPASPPFTAWLSGLDFCMALERPIFKARGCPRKHGRIWRRWADYRGLPLEPP